MKIDSYSAEQLIKNLRETPNLVIIRIAGEFVLMTRAEFTKIFGK